MFAFSMFTCPSASVCIASLAQSEEHMARMTAGDELKLTLDPVGQRAYGKPWEGLGQVLRIADSEVALMMQGGNVPLEITDGYQVRARVYASEIFV